jgi:acetyl-CoA/propionyl-CoA carboxylase biotin carboxyl carrier protein
MQVAGMPTVLPFHRAVVSDPAFAPADGAPFTVHTRWIETGFENTIAPFSGTPGTPGDAEEEHEDRRSVTVEVNGKRVEVTLPAILGAISTVATGAKAGSRRRKSRGTRGATATGANGDTLTSPMQGTIVKVAAGVGDAVAEGDLIVVLEAMKMEQPLTAHKSGTITELSAEVGATVTAGAAIAAITD